MTMLHEMKKGDRNKANKVLIEKFLLKLQPSYPEKLTVTYERDGEAIPMPMDHGEPIILEMFKGEAIPLRN